MDVKKLIEDDNEVKLLLDHSSDDNALIPSY